MKVYAVIGGWNSLNYEGEDFESLRLFDCKSAAEKYQEFLTEEDGFDYAQCSVREVCMESAIVTL